ncbi:MAG: TPM domain-containing protein [Sphingomonas bacterium]
MMLVAALMLLGAQAVQAQTFPKLTGRVVDAADLLSPEQEAQLTQLSADIEKASSRQFVVATVPDLQSYPIEDYGYRLGRAWNIGQKGANNGIMLIVAPNERKVRIEVGYGLEPIMTDALSSQIINDTILPRFKAGDMPGGIIAGANAIGEQMKLPLEAGEARAAKLVAKPVHVRSSGGGIPFPLIFLIIVIAFFILSRIRRGTRGRRYRGGVAPVVLWGSGLGGGSGSGWGSSWSSGGSSSWGGGGGDSGGGGGGFSGGGGSFGGGGASGGW